MKYLIGKWFHSFKGNELSWQGQILSRTPDGKFEVQLYNWMGGEPTDIKIVSLDEMSKWNYYKSDKDMRAHYQFLIDNEKILRAYSWRI